MRRAPIVATMAWVIAGPVAAAAQATTPRAAPASAPWPPVATFSVLGYDPATGEVGGAVQSRVFSVGNGVLWADADVGVVATQAIVDVSYGPQALALLRGGMAPAQVVRQVWERDPDPRPADWTKQGRQFAVIDARGNVAAYTGPRASAWAGHRTGRHVTAQGNILAGEAVVDRMVEAFERTEGHLSERLLAALEAGQAAGGDRRGMQSAAMVVVKKGGGVWLNNDVVMRLQVDDHPEPIAELRRLVERAAVWNRLARVDAPRPSTFRDGDSPIVAALERDGMRHTSGRATVHWPRDSFPEARMRALADTLDLGIRDMERLLGPARAWQRFPSPNVRYYIAPGAFISHVDGAGRVFIRSDRVRDERAPFLHETSHVFLMSRGPLLFELPDSTADRQLGVVTPWLGEGAASWIGDLVAERIGTVEGDPFDGGGNAGVDRACAAWLARAEGQRIEPFIGRAGVPPGLFTDRRGVAAPFYVCAQSYVKFLGERWGAPAVSSLLGAKLGAVPAALRAITRTEPDSLRARWRRSLPAAPANPGGGAPAGRSLP